MTNREQSLVDALVDYRSWVLQLVHDLRNPLSGVLGCADLLLTADEMSGGPTALVRDVREAGMEMATVLGVAAARLSEDSEAFDELVRLGPDRKPGSK